ncbi:hypothetical protein ANAEL_03663 [Anaerolineales bacterium]|nr:hypothetical protein ANAEL_03663 [Anaerolineales bacterium]
MNNTRTWRDLIAVVSLAALFLLAAPLCGSLLQDQTKVMLATPTPFPSRVYLFPFRHVFALGMSQPITPTQILLYENGSDVFQMIDQQGEFVRLQTRDGAKDFWTPGVNIALEPPPAAQSDFSVRGRIARLNDAAGFACLHDDNAAPPLSVCQSPPGFASATLVARVTSSAIQFYLAEVNGKMYFLSPDAVSAIQ